MSSKAIAFLAGLGTGAMNETLRQEKLKRDEEDRALRNTAAQQQIDAASKVVRDQRTIADAAAPVTATEGANGMLKPDTMDNSDVGLPENANLPNGGLNQGAYSVAGKSYTDKAAADAAVAAANTPEATNSRIIAAQRGIDPVKAMTLEKDATANKAAELQLADSVFRKKLGVAMAGGHDGLAKLVSDSTSDGMADHQLKAVVSPDGKSVTYNKVGADGTLTPTNLTFSNDEQGVTMAAYRLDQTITPDKRLDFALKVRKEESESKERDAHGEYFKAFAALKDATDPNLRKGSASTYDRMSEIDKATLGSINKQRETINNAITKGQVDGSYDDKSPGAQALKGKLAALALQERQLQERYSDGSAPASADPLNLNRPPAGAKPNVAAGGINNPATQGARDVEAGNILMQEYGGDVGKAQAAATELAGEVSRAKGDAKAILQGQLNRLQIGIANAGKTATPQTVVAPQPVVASQPAVVAPVVAPAAAPVAAPVVAQKPNLAAALGANTGNASIDQVVAAKVPAVQAAGADIQKAKQALAAVAKSGDPQALAMYSDQLAQARAKLDVFLKNMNAQQAEQVRTAVGY